MSNDIDLTLTPHTPAWASGEMIEWTFFFANHWSNQTAPSRVAFADSERLIGKPVESAVVGVPTYFNSLQQEAIKDAALLLASVHMHLISGSTLAATACTQ